MKYIKYFAIVIVIFIIVWQGISFFIPYRILNVSPDQVKMIEVFNGGTGERVIVEDRHFIERIINNLNSVTLKKEKISIHYMGYSFRVKIINNNNRIINNFIVNSENSIRKDPFFYMDASGSIDVNFISSLFVK